MIPEGSRRTACISSQAGCGIGCPFCATGLGRTGAQSRQRARSSIKSSRFQRVTGERVSNVVFMGMGEPFANYHAGDESGSPPHGSATDLGSAPAISRSPRREWCRRSAASPAKSDQFVLAISLHAATDDVRDRLVPLNRKYPIAQLMDACRDYIAGDGTADYLRVCDDSRRE